MRFVWFATLALLISIRAEPPELRSINPIGASRGTTNQFTIHGKTDPWPPRFWSHPPGLKFITDTNKNKATIEIPADAAPGPRLVRIYNEEGVSEPRFFVVGEGREIAEKEINNKFSEAQPAGEFPVVISGKLDKGDDVDCFIIQIPGRKTLEASIEAYTLMSKMDAVLRLVTTNGITLAWNHDYGTFDPHLWHTAPTDQTVVVQVFGFAYPANSEIRLTGGDEAPYRLHLNWSQHAPSRPLNIDTNVATLPFERSGALLEVRQEHRYSFRGQKDQYIIAQVEAASVGSPLDPYLRILDANGTQISRTDDAEGSADPRVEWKCPADTNYFIAIGNTLNRAGSNYTYKLTAETAPPDFKAIWSVGSATFTAGTTNTVKIDFKRLREHTNEVIPTFRNIPESVVISPLTNLPAKGGEVSFALTINSNAPPFQGPIQLALMDSTAKKEKLAVVELTTRGENNGVPNGYSKLAIESYDHMWLTIKTQEVKAATNVAAKP